MKEAGTQTPGKGSRGLLGNGPSLTGILEFL